MSNETDSTYHGLILTVLKENNLSTDEKKLLIDELRKAAPPKHDRWIYRYTIGFLGLAVFVSLVTVFVLSMAEDPIPDAMVALGSASVGALAGLIAPPSGDQ
jgi:hypothetical protein